MRRSLFFIAGLLGLSSLALCAKEWPLTGPLLCHDPSIIKEGDTWWCFYTGKGLPCKTSSDGVDWNQAPNLFSSEQTWWREFAPNMGEIDTWAPDISYYKGRYWLYYSVSEFGKNNSAIGLMSCSSLAAGDWKNEGVVVHSKAGQTPFNAIDPNLGFDEKGQPWLCFGSWFIGINLVQLDPETMKPKGEVTTLATRENGIEGPVIVHKDNFYYLFVAIDKCCSGVDSTYKSMVGRSRSITGPYVDKAGVDLLAGGGTILEVGAGRYKGPGGASVFKNADNYLFVRHAYDAEAAGKPMLRIAELYWDSEGWPSLCNNTGANNTESTQAAAP